MDVYERLGVHKRINAAITARTAAIAYTAQPGYAGGGTGPRRASARQKHRVRPTWPRR